MRISDWSSDVCSSDLNYNPVVVANHRLYARAFLDYLAECDIRVESVTPGQVDQYFHYAIEDFQARYGRDPSPRWHKLPRTAISKLLRLAQGKRSEEHTSELQSLMRISSAVFCLKK